MHLQRNYQIILYSVNLRVCQTATDNHKNIAAKKFPWEACAQLKMMSMHKYLSKGCGQFRSVSES